VYDVTYTIIPIPIWYYLVLSTLLFNIGLFAVLSRRNAIGILMGLELMFNAANINLVAFNQRWGITMTLQAFSRASNVASPVGQMFTIFTITIAAAEIAIGIALIIAMYRHYKSINTEAINLLKW
jgi:NADH:ubiquinone oxidoreductase subunit K